MLWERLQQRSELQRVVKTMSKMEKVKGGPYTQGLFLLLDYIMTERGGYIRLPQSEGL